MYSTWASLYTHFVSGLISRSATKKKKKKKKRYCVPLGSWEQLEGECFSLTTFCLLHETLLHTKMQVWGGKQAFPNQPQALQQTAVVICLWNVIGDICPTYHTGITKEQMKANYWGTPFTRMVTPGHSGGRVIALCHCGYSTPSLEHRNVPLGYSPGFHTMPFT